MKPKSLFLTHTLGAFRKVQPLFFHAVFAVAWLALATLAQARDFRVNMLPNGTKFGCANCHVSAGGGGARNAFGNAVNARVTPGGAQQFWDAALAMADSDGDGFSNGTELGDPDGDRQNVGPSAAVTNPGSAASKPVVNTPPTFTSTPVTTASIGLPYSYQATATDAQNNTRTFSKTSGPSWLTVSAAGLASGTAPEGAAGSFEVIITVTDNGVPALSTNQTYNLTVSSSLAGWQALNFTLPAEAAIAAADQDPDGDGLPNLIEYALRKNPKQSDAFEVLDTPTFDGSGHMTFAVVTRDDDAKLMVTLEASGSVTLTSPEVVNPVITDGTAGDGLHTRTFTDTAVRTSTAARFGRLRFELLP